MKIGKDIKFIGLVALGVLAAGALMHYGRGLMPVDVAHDGFDS